jgi:hypothetical protein
MLIDINLKEMLRYVDVKGTLSIVLYWSPLVMCAIGYTARTARNYMKDKQKRQEVKSSGTGYYSPTDTIGTLIGRGISTICPAVNLWCAAFDIFPSMIGPISVWISNTFNQPLVPKD